MLQSLTSENDAALGEEHRSAQKGLRSNAFSPYIALMKISSRDEYFMRMALKQAKLAEEAGDVPVGAVIVLSDAVIGRAHNQVELLKDATAPAEMIAIT